MVDWTAMVLLGAYHGFNPAMGWLFAVALGMQQGSVRGVIRALPPIAVGHSVSIAGVLLAAISVQAVLPMRVVGPLAGTLLVAFGILRLWRHRHPIYGGMQVGFRDLAIWSFLIASAHGAGLMLLPFVLDLSTPVSASSVDHASHIPAAGAGTPAVGAVVLVVHTLSYFVVMMAVAWVVYRKLGLAILRTAWFDMDRIWSWSLLITGAAVLAWHSRG